MKIVCAAICKNEEHNVQGLIENLHQHGIQELCVTDTGSTDRTLELLRDNTLIRVNIKQIAIEPFNFSAAKNTLIELIPADADFVLHLDFDERLQSLPSELDPKMGYSCNRHEKLYNMISCDMPRLTPRSGWWWQHAIHEVLVPEFSIKYAPEFVIEHWQRPGKDCYESLTEYWFPHDPQRLYPHRLTDLIHNQRYQEYIQLFEQYGAWDLTELNLWRAVKNYVISCFYCMKSPRPDFVRLLEKFSSSSNCYYLALAYLTMNDLERAMHIYRIGEHSEFDSDNEKIYYNQNIKTIIKSLLGA